MPKQPSGGYIVAWVRTVLEHSTLTEVLAMESEFVGWLRRRIATSDFAPLGLSDDAALLRLKDSQCVLTSDMLMDGVDFEIARCDAQVAGRKALAVNLSDLAAMAARPVAAIISLALPQAGGRTMAEQLYEGMIPLAEDYGLAIVGGDTNSWHGPLVLSITAVGEVTERGPLLRSGALPGDAVLVTGEFGGSILGRHLDFRPRIEEACFLHDRFELHAGIDVSDGLSLDLARLAQESGCGAVMDLDTIPVSAASHRFAEAAGNDRTALDHALGDGEDFELILAVPFDVAQRLLREQPIGVPLTCIGHFVEEPGLWRLDGTGRRRLMQPRGYEHQMDR